MTVKELKELLDKLPDDAEVIRETGDHQFDYVPVKDVDYKPTSTFAREANTVLIQ